MRQFSEMPTFPRPLLHNSQSYHRQFFPRPSPFITRPSLIYNRFHQQPYTPRPFNHQWIPLLPLPSHQIPAFPGPHQQTPGHLTPQVSYIPVLLPYWSQLITLLQYHTTWDKEERKTQVKYKTFHNKTFYFVYGLYIWTINCITTVT